ncbi:MAG: tetratricopeptide repeat protein [Bacteroidota bacterium]
MSFSVKILSISILLFFYSFGVNSQESKDYTTENSQYNKALELFEKEKYTNAKQLFSETIGDLPEDTELRANAEYYIAICAIELYHKDAEHLISRFISKHPESSRVNHAYFNMGRFQYRQEEYEKVVNWFEKLEKEKLNEEQLAEYRFKKGYSHFKIDEKNKASQEFYEIKDKNTKFSGPALYYYSHIAYNNENYQTALEGFQSLTGNNTFSPIMPYYITQIYYLQDRYEKVTEYAPQYVQSATTKRLPEIAKIIGDSYYQLRQYDSAMTYLDMHAEEASSLSREDHYQLGYVSYKLEKYEKAIESFEKVTDKEDELAQNAYYHLADCYLSMDKKNEAKLAFEFASKLDYDLQIRQNALFNYAKIVFQLKNTPFNDAVKAFKSYIEQYPDADNIKEAYGYLVKAYLNTNNYKEALLSLEKIEDKDESLKKAYQKVAYYRGLELYNNRDYKEAIDKLSKSLDYKEYHEDITALSYYWRGEAFYQLEQFEQASENLNLFIMSPRAFSSDVYNKAHYNIAYSYFMQEEYPEAIKWFRKYLNLTDEEESEYLADTYNRLGDCYFMRRSLWQAVEYYDKAVDLELRDQDYALYQRAVALGLLERPEKKIRSLKRLVENFPESDYLNNAYFELGKSYMNLDNPSEAKTYYEQIVENYSSGEYVKKALVELGLINYNEGNNDEAMKVYKRVVADYPSTREAKNALKGLKNIYLDRNNVDEYFSYVDGLDSGTEVSVSEKDSLIFASAEKAYMDDGCDEAFQPLKRYLSDFKNGNFAVDAHFYIADCYEEKDETEKAVEHYEFVLDKSDNAFTEQALSSAMEIHREQENIDKAIEYYKRMEKIAEVHSNLIKARTGLMRMYFQQEEYEQALKAADKVLSTEKVNSREEREAHYIKGKSYFYQEDYDRAMENFQKIAEEVNSEEGAEAKYRIAQIYYKKEEYKTSENEIFDFVQQNSSQEYWKAKSYLLLADVYEATDDKFQAKHTLKSIIDNYKSDSEEDEIIDLAKERYDQLRDTEETEVDTTDEEMEIDLGKDRDKKEEPLEDNEQ